MELYKTLESDLKLLRMWSLRRSDPATEAMEYDIIRSVDVHGGLVYPVKEVLTFFDSLQKMRVLLFRKLKNDPKHIAHINEYVRALLMGSFAVESAKKLSLISITNAHEALHSQTPEKREALAKSGKENKDNADTNERDVMKIDQKGVNLLTAIVRRYINTTCRSIEKSLRAIVVKEIYKKKEWK